MLERELKLRFEARHGDRLPTHPLLRELPLPKSNYLLGTYFDTPQCDLLRLGVGLRIRREHDRLVQCMKTAGSVTGGLHQRQEWEAQVETLEPDFDKLPQAAQTLLDPSLWPHLEAVFTTDFTRRVWHLDYHGSQVEICLDQGRIHNGGHTAPISEIELELKSGNPAALFEIALEFHRHIPVHVENASKAQRGYALGRPQKPLPCKAGELRLAADCNAAQALPAIVRHHLAQLQANEAAAYAGHDPEGVHQMRVALRRLRSCFGLYKGCLPNHADKQIRGQLLWLSEILGTVRDLDVFAETLEQIAERRPHPLKKLRQHTGKQRQDSHAHLRKALDSQAYTHLLLDLGRWTWQDEIHNAPALQLPAKAFAADILDRQAAKLKKKGANLLRLSAKKRHRVRIDSKKLAYGLAFFRFLFDESATTEYLHVLSALRDDLGLLNDSATAQVFLDDPHVSDSAGAYVVQGWYAARETDALRRLQGNWKCFLALPQFWAAGIPDSHEHAGRVTAEEIRAPLVSGAAQFSND